MIKDEITVVSGLPRSGTSMSMQMLKAGGLDVFVDQQRKADKDNPQGYLEFEKVKHLDEDNSWLDKTQGKVIKVVSLLLEHLPDKFNYQIIFMDRNLDEVLASQKKMIKRRQEKNKVSDLEIKESFKKHLKKIKKWLDEKQNISVCYLKYDQVVQDPQSAAEKIIRFLDKDLDLEKMVSVVNPDLYRNKAK